MKKELKTIWIAVAVLALAQIIGGCIFTARTAAAEHSYTYVDCTVVSVRSTQEGDTVTVTGITVSYPDQEGKTVEAQMADFPTKFSVGSKFRGRYQQDPQIVSAQQTDWFTPVFLIVLGVAYALGDLAVLLLRKKMGLYALEETRREEPEDEEVISED